MPFLTKEENGDKWYFTTQNIQENLATDNQHVSDKVFLLAFVDVQACYKLYI
jgi:hypothetical protein